MYYYYSPVENETGKRNKPICTRAHVVAGLYIEPIAFMLVSKAVIVIDSCKPLVLFRFLVSALLDKPCGVHV